MTQKKIFSPEKITRFGFYLFAAGIPLSFVPAEFAIALIWIGWMMEGLVHKHWQARRAAVFIPIVVYLLWNIVSSVHSPRPLHSLAALADNEWPVTIMVFMFFLIEDAAVLLRMLELWLLTSCISSVYAIWQTFSGNDFLFHNRLSHIENYYRAEGFSHMYLTFAGFAMTIFLVGLCLSTQRGQISRWKYVVPAVLSFIAIIGSFARSVWLSFGVVFPIFGFLKGKRTGGIIVSVFLGAFLVGMIFVGSIRERAFSIIDPSQNQTRLNLWQTTLHMSADHLTTGIGEDNFDYYFEAYKVPGIYDATGHPHNDYLTVLVSSGIPGICLFLTIWTMILRLGFSTWRRSEVPVLREVALGGTLSIIGFLVGSFFQNYYGTFANCWGWWFMAGIIMTSYKLSGLPQTTGSTAEDRTQTIPRA